MWPLQRLCCGSCTAVPDLSGPDWLLCCTVWDRNESGRYILYWVPMGSPVESTWGATTANCREIRSGRNVPNAVRGVAVCIRIALNHQSSGESDQIRSGCPLDVHRPLRGMVVWSLHVMGGSCELPQATLQAREHISRCAYHAPPESQYKCGIDRSP